MVLSNDEVKQNDLIRQKQLEQEGLRFLRFSNREMRLKQGGVILKIETYLKEKIEISKNSST